ncbi:MAG: tRNA-dihydrouridine synthase, partial [Vicinamibacteria bacterium]|nr:tRNA-dihydrouridine synthase [Vicinamibacteria bacterium]
VTIKVRIGIDDAHENYLEAGRIAQEEGCQAIGLHARTATQFYGGEARWDAIARLKQSVARIRVLGNGDVFEAHDALRMMRTTNCDGVIVGRGCLGRPWLFRELAALFAGCEPENPPDLGGVIDVMRDHARRLAAWMGEMPGMCAFRKHSAWYTKAWPGSAALRQRLMSVKTLVELDMVLANVDRTRPYPPEAMRAARGKSGGGQRVVLPAGFWDAIDDDAPPEDCGDESTGEGG